MAAAGTAHPRGGDTSSNSNSNNTPSSAPATSYALARGASDTVFKGIVVSKGLGAVGVEDAIDTSKHDLVRETQRDYTAAIKALLTMIDNTSKNRNRQGNSSLAQGDVTQHAIDRAVTRAYETSSLGTFEQSSASSGPTSACASPFSTRPPPRCRASWSATTSAGSRWRRSTTSSRAPASRSTSARSRPPS